MTARTPDEVSLSIREKLQTTIPGLSLEIGTIERKIVDACSEAISEATVGQYHSGSILDIETKSGSELEQLVGIFGFGRLQGRRATGVVRMEMVTVATQPVQIQKGSQFSVRGAGAGGTNLNFISTQSAVITEGSYSTDIPVQCALIGSIGNVPPGSITSVSATLGATSVTNLTAMSGGIDPETDDELRARFRATFLRNISGTEDFYRAMCLQNSNVSQAVVYGPTNLYRTQAEVASSTTQMEVSSNVKYVWPRSEQIFKNLATEDEVFYRNGSDYTFLYQSQPVFTLVDSGDMEPGSIVDVEFEYTTRSSRNDPVNGITNKVDIFVNGSDPVLVNEKTVVSSTNFSTSSSSEYYTGKFFRAGTRTRPSSSNRFMRLGSVPIVSFPSRLNIDNTLYSEGVHYFVVEGEGDLAGSEREVAGIEWTSAGPTSGTPITVSYTYNRTPELLNAQLKGTKQITTDVLVRQASYAFLQVNLSVEYHRGHSIQQVNNNIQAALRGFFSQVGYGDWIEFQDFLTVVHQVAGVDNVWVTKLDEDSAHYGIDQFVDSHRETKLTTRSEDFQLEDNQLPIFLEANIKRRANR